MPIRINLLAEAQAEEELRRRDPVKRAIFVGAFLVALAFAWFSGTWLEHMNVNRSLEQVQAEIHSHTNNFDQVQTDLKQIASTQKRLAALQELSAARFLQGNLMNALQKLYVPNVQLMRLHVDQSYAITPAVKPHGTTPGRHATSTEHIILTLDAKDSSANPGEGINHFKNELAKLDFFKNNLDPAKGIRLSNLSPPQTGPDGKSYVMFTLECRFADHTR